MELSVISKVPWSRFSDFIAEAIGLHFPPERWSDLQRGLAGAAQEFGCSDVGACVDWLLASPLTKVQLQVLASHLTVGETYFFREKKTFDALAESVLPELIRSRRNREQRLRIWSAACCTGEEPYSLAILLHQLIPDLTDWRVTILATDINGRFLQKATSGVYGEWSFRETPGWLKDQYFQRAANGRYTILPEIKKLVTFAHINLVEDVFPSLATDTNAMDMIFCRNVLMYFTLPQTRKVVQRLHNSLIEGSWLVVSPTEASQSTFSRFIPVNFPGAILYQKSNMADRSSQSLAPAMLDEATEFRTPPLEVILPRMPQQPTGSSSLEISPVLPTDEQVTEGLLSTKFAAATELYRQGRYGESEDMLRALFAESSEPDPQAFSVLARVLANQGKLTDARGWCDRWVAANKLDASGHYLRAVVAQELGDHEQARLSFQRTIYLQPGFVLAHFAQGNLARNQGKSGEAGKHYANALNLLRGCATDEMLPESDGLTAGRLTEIISTLNALDTRP